MVFLKKLIKYFVLGPATTTTTTGLHLNLVVKVTLL